MTLFDEWLLRNDATFCFIQCAGFYRCFMGVNDVGGSMPVAYSWTYENLDRELIQPAATIIHRIVEYRDKVMCWHCGGRVALTANGWHCLECPEYGLTTHFATTVHQGCAMYAPVLKDTENETDKDGTTA